MKITDLATVNAILNAISAVLLLFGYINIKKGRADLHKRFMIAALISSALFLISYTVYHYSVGSVPYTSHDWTRPLYFVILIPHVTLAGLMTPFIVAAVWLALKGKFATHKKITVWLWPVWMFVSLSGIAVYLMLYRLKPFIRP
jgi:putative membrane protein